ncbi:response regulator transcription factor [Bizionia echini]|uniref:response regulator transcription factor n=1 Tax=Bizionia echini TaxID=649333 RepID=UPI0030D7CA82|tara:strand:- start:716 stop:1126 length:411 start_codon:yes stop_codon:yes gene_type:complete
MKKTVFIFSALIIALLSLFQLSQYAVIYGDLKIEIAIAFSAIVCFFVGVYISKKNSSHQPILTKKIDTHKLKELEITTREYAVLKQISEGLSNKEIGEKLFVSESTVKTHVSNLLAKLQAKRRTEALKIAKQLEII